MRSIVRSLWSRAIARVMVFAVAVPLGLAPAAGAQQGVAVLVIPLENKSQTGGEELAQRVTDALKMALEASGRAAVVTASASSPIVVRAIEQDRTLSAEDIRPPWDVDKARKVGRALGAKIALLGTIDNYVFDEKSKQVTISLTIQRVDVASDEPPVSIGVTGRSAEKLRPLAKEGPLMVEALDDAALKVSEAVVGTAAAPPVQEKPHKKKSSISKWLGPLLAIAAIVALASGGKGGPSGTTRVASPISNALTSATESTVALSWSVTGTKLPSNFSIWRAPAGIATLGGEDAIYNAGRAQQAVAGPYEKLNMVLEASTRNANDSGAMLGQLYAYQIRAVISGKETDPVDFHNSYQLPTQTVVVGPGVPLVPRGVSIGRGPGSLAATIHWQANPEPFVQGYRVYRGNNPGAVYLLGEFPPGTTQHDDFRNLQANATYYYVVSAIGSSVGTRFIESRTAPIPYTLSPGALTPPSGLQAAAGQDSVVLSWTPSPDLAVLGYNLYRNEAKIKTISGRLTAADTDTGLQPSTTYSYFLRSFDTNGAESVNSNTASATTTSPPSDLVCDAQPATIIANGADKSTITAKVTDTASNPIAGVTVVFQRIAGEGTLEVVSGSGGRVVGSTIEAPSDAGGVARAALKAPSAVPTVATQVMATVKDLPTISCTATVTITAPTAASVSVVATPQDVIADGLSQSTITATVKDASGIGVSGVSVHFTISNTSLGVLSASDVTSGAQGRAIVKVTSAAPNAIGPAQVTAAAAGKTGKVTINFIAQPSLTVSVNPTMIPAGGIASTALVTATVKKSDGTRLPGQVVHFGFDLPGAPTASTTGATISPENSTSDSAGLAFSTVTSPPNVNGGDADVILVWLDTNGSKAFESGEDRWAIVGISYTEPPASVTVAADPASLPADQTSTSRITADVRTAIPNPIGPGNKPVADGTVVDFSTSDGVFSPSDRATTVNGIATVYLRTSDTPGTVTVSATSASVSGSTQVQFTPVAERILTVTADPGAISANGTATSTITAYLRKSDGTPVSGQAVTFTTTLGTLTAVQATTGTNGRATTTLTAGREAGTAAVTAAAGELEATVHVSFTGGAPARVDFTAMAPGIIAATGGLPSLSGAPVSTSVFARVTDEFGNAVQDGTVVLFHSDIGQISASVGTADGVAMATLVASTFETATNAAIFKPGICSVNAWAGSLSGPTAGPVHAIFAGDLDTYTLSGADNSTSFYTSYGADWRTQTVGGFGAAPNLSPRAGDTVYVYLILRDANNNPLPLGVPVDWIVRYGGEERFTGTATTGMVNGETRISFSFSPEQLSATPTSRVLADISVTTPPISSTVAVGLGVQQWIGSTAASTISGPPESPECLVNNTCTCSITAEFRDIKDQYGNLVQDGTPVYFSWESPVNLESIQLTPSTGASIGGRASVLVTARTTRDDQGVCQAGSLAVVAIPQTTVTPPPRASVSVNFNAP